MVKRSFLLVWMSKSSLILVTSRRTTLKNRGRPCTLLQSQPLRHCAQSWEQHIKQLRMYLTQIGKVKKMRWVRVYWWSAACSPTCPASCWLLSACSFRKKKFFFTTCLHRIKSGSCVIINKLTFFQSTKLLTLHPIKIKRQKILTLKGSYHFMMLQ